MDFYAFAIIDEDKKKFMVARDPIGIKPLYYGTDKNGTMWFASEMKSLCDACVDINVFPPGHYYTPETGFVKFYIPKWETATADDFDASDLRDYLERSVDKRLMCDVPFGVLLSGGLDSSLIAAITARKLKEQGKQLHSFSIGLDGNRCPRFNCCTPVCGVHRHHTSRSTLYCGRRNSRCRKISLQFRIV